MAHDMQAIDGGELLMGSGEFYVEEGPVVRRQVDAFRIDRHPVTNRQFAEFVAATAHVTIAELPPGPVETADAGDSELSSPGSLVFVPTDGPVPLEDWRQWWAWVPDASWRHPQGPGSDLEGKADHPVVQVAYPDALAYARWAGLQLPKEVEWEYAARGGLVGATYAWGDELRPGGRLMANTWQGRFPYDNTGADGWVGTSPVGTFPANGYGLSDMTGNVWEWTSDRFTPRHDIPPAARHSPGTVHSCCGPTATGPGVFDPDEEVIRVLKGGSHLCAPEYCLRYRPAARSPQEERSATSHVGFRCVDRRH